MKKCSQEVTLVWQSCNCAKVFANYLSLFYSYLLCLGIGLLVEMIKE